jgi:carboxymethylenebutenolidase
METEKTNDPKRDASLKQYLIDEFVEDYSEGRMSRREALSKLGYLTGSLVIANTLLAACAPPPTTAPTPTSQPPAPGASPTAASLSVSASDASIEASPVRFPGQGATLLGYLAKPKGDGPFSIVLVCHENRGLTEHIKDVTRRVAKADYVGFAVDLLSRQGGTDKVDPNQAPGALGNTPPAQMVQDFQSGLDYVKPLKYARANKAGMVGFCFGGGVTWRCAQGIAELLAAVPYYGPNPPIEDVPKINAAVLGIYGALDTRIDAGIPEIEEAMKKAGKTFDKVVYPNANHAFNNDTGGSYNAQAASDAWSKTLAWLAKYLRG